MDFKTLSDRTTRTALTFICEWYLVEWLSRGWVEGSNPVRVEQILSKWKPDPIFGIQLVISEEKFY